MNEHKYLTHLIKFRASKMSGAKYWLGRAEVQYNDGKAWRFFEVQASSKVFASKTKAEQYILETAKKLIDNYI